MFWFYPYRIHFCVKPEAAAQRLAESSGATTLIVEQKAQRLKVGREIGRWERGSFAPLFIGRFSEVRGGSVLSGYFRPPLPVLYFMGMFVLLHLFYFYQDFSRVADAGLLADIPNQFFNPSRSVNRTDLSKLCQALLLVNLCGWLFELPTQRRILRILRESSGTEASNRLSH